MKISICLNTLAEHRQRCHFALPNHTFAEKYARWSVCVCVYIYFIFHLAFSLQLNLVDASVGVYVAFECNKCICAVTPHTYMHTYIHMHIYILYYYCFYCNVVGFGSSGTHAVIWFHIFICTFYISYWNTYMYVGVNACRICFTPLSGFIVWCCLLDSRFIYFLLPQAAAHACGVL